MALNCNMRIWHDVKKIWLIVVGILILAFTTTATAFTEMQVVEQQLQINGKPNKVFNIVQPNGTIGYIGQKGQIFDAIVENKTHEPIILDWHGLVVPNSDDGAPFVTQKPIEPGEKFHYHFPLEQAGTFWMHGYHHRQMQELMAAPFIVLDADTARASNIVMFLQDYTSQDLNEAYTKVREQLRQKQMPIQLSGSIAEEDIGAQPEILGLDAYLANQHTLTNPVVVRLNPETRVRLRVINASANTNYFLDLGTLEGVLVAVDGEPVAPLQGSRFQLAQGQRADIEIVLPSEEKAYPILAQAAGTNRQSGIVLATPQAAVPKLSDKTNQTIADLNYDQELNLHALNSLPAKNVNHKLDVNLEGNLVSYSWNINGQYWPNVTPITIKEGERIEMAFHNKTVLPLPLRLHGHLFQVTEIDGKQIRGALRDTVLVLPNSNVTVQFDANNPGIWLLRSYVPYLSYSGMITLINYEGYPVPIFNRTGLTVKQTHETPL
jgi:FtsP/CotA-like multicopper oxidase with cupredoxin domain